MKKHVVKQVNYDKVGEITQEKDKTPAPFQGYLVEALRKHTNEDPNSAEGSTLLGVHFTTTCPWH